MPFYSGVSGYSVVIRKMFTNLTAESTITYLRILYHVRKRKISLKINFNHAYSDIEIVSRCLIDLIEMRSCFQSDTKSILVDEDGDSKLVFSYLFSAGIGI